MISDIGEVTVKVKADFSELAKQFREMADKLDPQEWDGPLRTIKYRPVDNAVAVYSGNPFGGREPVWVVVYSDSSSERIKESKSFFDDDEWVEWLSTSR